MEYGRRISVLAFLLFMSFAAAAQSEKEDAVPYKRSNESDLDECDNWHEINPNDYFDSSKEQIVRDLHCSMKRLRNKSNYTKNAPIYYAIDNNVYEMSQEDLDCMTEIDKHNYRIASQLYWRDGSSNPSLLLNSLDIIARKDKSYITFNLINLNSYKKEWCIKIINKDMECKMNNIAFYSGLIDKKSLNQEAILVSTPEWKFYRKRHFTQDYDNMINLLRRINMCEIKKKFSISKVPILYSIFFRKALEK